MVTTRGPGPLRLELGVVTWPRYAESVSVCVCNGVSGYAVMLASLSLAADPAAPFGCYLAAPLAHGLGLHLPTYCNVIALYCIVRARIKDNRH